MLSKSDFIKAGEFNTRISNFIDAVGGLGVTAIDLDIVQVGFGLFDLVISSHFNDEQCDYIFQQIYEKDRTDYDNIYNEVNEKV